MKRFLGITAAVLIVATSARAAEQSNAIAYSQGANAVSFAEPLPKSVQEDLGDIRPAEDAGVLSYFHGEASVAGQYTSNAPLYHTHDAADFLIAPQLKVGFTAPLSKHFSVNADIRLEDFTYASHQNLGFWGVSGDATLDYHYKPTWPRLYAGVAPYYYVSYAGGQQLTASFGPIAGIDQSWSINRGKTLLFAGYQFGQFFSSPTIDTRVSQAVAISVTQQLRRDLYAQVYWQLQYSDFTVDRRDEMRNLEGVSLIHQFNPRTFISLFANYIDNASNSSLAKYTTINTGVSLVWQF